MAEMNPTFDLRAVSRTALGVPLFLVMILAMVIVPLPPRVLDILFTFNIALSLVVIMLLFTGVYSLFAFKYSSPELGPVLSGYLGLLLLAACFIPVGLLCSALTENQIVAAVLTFGVLLLLWVIGWAAESASYTTREIIQYLSLTDHLDDLTKGVIDTKDIVFYLSFCVMGLFLTKMALESRRWR